MLTILHDFPGKDQYASLDGGLAIAVPTEVRGLHAAWQRYGTRPWAELIQPAAQLARSGYAAHPYLIYVMSGPSNKARIQVGHSSPNKH